MKLNALAEIARDGAMVIAWACALPAIVALVVKLVRPDRPLLMSGRAIVFLLLTLTLSAGVLTNLTFKSYWGRPRPVTVTQFNGDQRRLLPGGIRAVTCARNCSFFSGEGATAFWTYAPAALTPPAWRPARLRRRDRVRGDDERAANGVRRALLYGCRYRRTGDVSGDLARPRLYLPLAIDPADG